MSPMYRNLLNSTQASYDEKADFGQALSAICQSLVWKDLPPWKQQKEQITMEINCNVRKEPSQDAESIGKLVGGQTMTKTGEDGDWIKIEFEGQTGYVRGDMFQ